LKTLLQKHLTNLLQTLTIAMLLTFITICYLTCARQQQAKEVQWLEWKK
jgi:preprotein translocase subunit YajC